jgi:hypothetical protein
MKPNKPLQKFLLLLVSGTWTAIAFQIYGTIAAGSDAEVEGAAGLHPRLKGAPFVYQADVRDPFYFPQAPRQRDSSRIVLPKPVWTPPPLKLTGILHGMNKRKKTAIVETATGGVFFLSEGDTVSGAKILKISANEVTYSYLKQKSQWTLEAH